MSGTTTAADLKGRMRDITPEQAVKWLEGKVHNRNVRQTKVDEYAADMKAGRWRETHQGIAFDEEGRLVDGQHRLFAVAQANKTVRMMVTEGVPHESMIAIDGGMPRTIADVIKIDDPDAGVDTYHVAIARAMMATPREGKIRMVTRQQLRDFLNKHWSAVRFAVDNLGPTKVRGITTAAAGAVIGRAFYNVNEDKLRQFCKVLITGQMTMPSESIIINYRNWALSVAAGQRTAGRIRSGRGSERRAVTYAKLETTLQAFLRGRKLTKIVGTTEELFLLPEEAARAARQKSGGVGRLVAPSTSSSMAAAAR